MSAITVTFFADHAAKTKDQREMSIAELVDLIATTTASSKQQLPWLKLAIFGDVLSDGKSLRHDANVKMLTGIEADYDGERYTFDAAVKAMMDLRLESIVYTSPSHRPDAPRWRILCPFSEPWLPEVHRRMMDRLNGAIGGVIGGESWTLSQSYYYGSVDRNPHHQVVHLAGDTIDQCDDLDEAAVGKPGFGGGGKSGGNDKRHTAEYWRAVLAGVPKHSTPELRELGIEGRDKAAASLAGRFLLEVERDDLMPLMREWNARNKPPLKGSDLARIVRSIGRRSGR